MDVILKQSEVCRITTLCREQIWKLEKEDKFPKRVRLSVNRIGWRKSDIDKYVASL